MQTVNSSMNYSEEEYKNFSNKILLFLFKYVLWACLLPLIPIFLNIYIEQKPLTLKLQIMESILTLIVTLLSLILLLSFFGFYSFQLVKKKSLSRSTLLSIYKEQTTEQKNGYNKKRIFIWILYALTVSSVITYTAFSIIVIFI